MSTALVRTLALSHGGWWEHLVQERDTIIIRTNLNQPSFSFRIVLIKWAIPRLKGPAVTYVAKQPFDAVQDGL
jgi:hypothetical protein